MKYICISRLIVGSLAITTLLFVRAMQHNILSSHFTLENSELQNEKNGLLNSLLHRPRCAIVGPFNDKKRIEIVTKNILEPNQQTYLTWSHGTPYSSNNKNFGKYVPEVGVQYVMVHANETGELVAAGYDASGNGGDWINRIDIIDARRNDQIQKILTFAIPQNEKLLNMGFDSSKSQFLMKTQRALYAWNLANTLQQGALINSVGYSENNSDSTKQVVDVDAVRAHCTDIVEAKEPENTVNSAKPIHSLPPLPSPTSFFRILAIAGLILSLLPEGVD